MSGLSKEIEITSASTPSEVGSISTTAENLGSITENVVVEWTAPFNGGLAITSYSVMIKADDNQFYEDKINCDASKSSIMNASAKKCTIPVSVLTADPFNLVWGATIKVQVYASNVIGTSSAEEYGSAVITNIPDSPHYINSNPTQTNAAAIGITWFDGDSNGGLAITKYEVQWALKSVTTFNTEPVEVKAFSMSGLTTDSEYQFKVRAWNLAGWSSYSKIIVIKTAKAPDAPTDLSIDQTTSTSQILQLSWTKGVDDGAAPVKNYIVYFDDESTGDW